MAQDEYDFIDPKALRLGLYVELDVGWLSHPFPSGSFKITTDKQIQILQSLGTKPVRWVPSKSDPDPSKAVAPPIAVPKQVDERQKASEQAALARRQRAEQLEAQQRSLMLCERRFADSVRQFRKSIDLIPTQPLAAAEIAQGLVTGYVADMLVEGESAIRLLADSSGDKATLHPVNVTVVSLLLGKALGLQQNQLVDLGVAAFLHDIGNLQLPERVRWYDDSLSASEIKLYQEHVARGVQVGRTMELSNAVLLAIAQHHEHADGSGFPQKLRLESISQLARIIALVNRYDGLCNPGRTGASMTPHEALSMIYGQFKGRYDPTILSAFIRMMGVYPPGSVVQLIDDRHAMVVSVNSARPLKPRVLVHEPGVPRHEAVILDLERTPQLGIRRSLRPGNLPGAAMDYLAPRPRVYYFYEQANDTSDAQRQPQRA
jgi:HD-GYP domain-containing protein (c-di-GMP phosphodiesterase class II)